MHNTRVSQAELEHPVLLVHGIWDSSRDLRALTRALRQAGAPEVLPIDLKPNDGRAPLHQLAEQVGTQARELADRAGVGRVDIVGFSMGALVARVWIQRSGGREHCRRFISVSGPHHGSLWAQMGRQLPGIVDMRPHSVLLDELAQDADPWGCVRVYNYFTPLDLMILPASSSKLPGVHRERRFWVPFHRSMVRNQRVLAKIIEDLGHPDESG